VTVTVALLVVAVGVACAWAGSRVAMARLAARHRRLREAAEALLRRGRPLVGLAPLQRHAPEDLAFALEELGESWARSWQTSREEQRRLQSVLSGLVDGVLLLDRGGRVLLANAAAEAIWPRLTGRLLGMNQIALFHDPDLDAALARARGSGDPETVVHVLAGPPRRYLEVRILPARDEEGSAGALLVLRDVTLRHAVDQMRRDFVANVSHELQTPLTTIRGFAETLVDEPEPPAADRRRFAGMILREAQRMTDLVRDLLELARLEAEAWRPAPEPVDLGEVAADVCERAQARAQARGLTLVRSAQGPAVVAGQADELRRALDNLVANAIAYTPAGGRIEVRTGSDPRGVYAAVSDTGIGIPAAEHTRIFERFYRVDRGRSRESGGTGLGLAIVRHVVESHGGRILLESAPGQGSTFTCVFPPLQPPSAASR
jgi:two-component system phosphate regulon sensor histidine kinase PhoR